MMEDPTAADFGSADASEPRRWRYRLPISISLVGIFIVLGFHLALRMQIRPPSLWIYWIGLVLVAVPGVLAGERKAATFCLGAFAFLQCFAYSLSSPFGLVYLRDPLYNMQLATLVQTTQTWHPAMGAGQAFAYSFSPGSNLFHVAVAFATGLPLETLYLFVTGILRFAVLPLGLARMLGRFVKPQATYVVVAIFLATPSNLFDLPHQQEFAYVFLILGLYAAIASTTVPRGFRFASATQLAALVFVATVAVSHAFTSYVSLFMFPAMPVVGHLDDSWVHRARTITYGHLASRGVIAQTFKGLRFTAVAFTGMFLSWSALVSSPLELAWLDYASESLERLFLPHQFIAPTGSAPSGVAAGFSYTPDELAIIGMSLLILLLTTLVGVFILWRRTDRLTGPARPSAGILLVLFVVALVPMVASAPLSVTGGLFIPLRIFEFSIFGFAPVVGLVFALALARGRLRNLALIAVVLSVLLVGGSLTQDGTPRYQFLPPGAVYSAIQTHLTTDMLRAAYWAKTHIDPPLVYGDELVQDAFGGSAGFNIAPEHWPAFPLFNASVLSGDLNFAYGLVPGDIVVTHVYMTRTVCFTAFRTTPLEPFKVEKFAQNSTFAIVYADATVTIYRWNGPA